jgi:hypothetical protein
MARRSDSQILQMGIISLALLLLVMVGSFNLQKLPWLRGTTYHAELSPRIPVSVASLGSTIWPSKSQR